MFSRASRVLLLPLLGASCALAMDVPEGFLQLETGGHEIKATTADEALLWVRQFADPHEASLEFWAEALHNDLVDRRGYRLVSRDTITDAAGRPGHVLQLEVTAEGRARGYLVVVYVVHVGILWFATQNVRVLEFVAEQEAFDKYAGAVRDASRTIR